jgi:hypothetical protein
MAIAEHTSTDPEYHCPVPLNERGERGLRRFFTAGHEVLEQSSITLRTGDSALKECV